MNKSILFFSIGLIFLSAFSCQLVRRDVLHPEWQAHFDSLGVHGGIVIFDESEKKMHVYNSGRIDSAFMPASTFKIPNSLIALQTGAVRDTSEIIPWDSVERFVPAWNQDHNMASALPVSAVWFYQEVARRIGAPTMRSYLDSLRYGNRDTSEIDMFWLNNSLKITPREQITFLEKVYHGRVPFDQEHIDAVKKLLILKKTDEYTLMGKTGWGTAIEPNVGWLVGWMEKGENVYHYATNIDIVQDEDRKARRKIVEEVFRDMGVIND